MSELEDTYQLSGIGHMIAFRFQQGSVIYVL